MSAVRVMAKLLTLSLGIISLVAVAETYYDQQFYTADFMDEVQEVELRMPAASEKRVVASEPKEKLPEIMKVNNPFSLKRAIDGVWQITRVISDNDSVVYDYINNEEDAEANQIKADFVYSTTTNTVRINGEIDQTYKITLMTDSGTIGLFKEYGEGYEVVEAVRFKKKISLTENGSIERSSIKASKFNIEEDLGIISALDPKNNRNVLRGDSITGSAYIKDGMLSLDGIQIHIGTEKQSESFAISDVNVAKHGTFNDDEGTQGIITNIGNDEVKIRFSTGPLAGVMLNFVTDEKRSQIEQKFGTPAPEQPNLPGRDVQEQAKPIQPAQKVDSYDEQEQQEDEYLEEEQGEYSDEDSYQDEEDQRYEDEMNYEDQDLIENIDEARDNAPNDLDREPASTNVSEVGFTF